MTPMTIKNDTNFITIEELLGSSDQQVRDFVDKLRKLIKEAAPEATERIYGDTKIIGYDHHGLFCYIDPKKTRVNVGVHKGAYLPDMDNLLEGNGKDLRHVKIKDKKDIKVTALKKLIKSAYRLNEEMGKQ